MGQLRSLSCQLKNKISGDNQGVKFFRRFKQLLNPAQVFDLVTAGPQLGLRLFRHFDPFRILICSGDGSVGWVLSEIDRLNMQVIKITENQVTIENFKLFPFF